MCDGDTCCQAITQEGSQCTRRAKIKFDLTRGKKIMGIQVIPKIKCCFFCTQHAATLTGYAVYEIGMFLATKDLEWDEYIDINPDYLDKKMKEMGYESR